jgi:hypothetical protein
VTWLSKKLHNLTKVLRGTEDQSIVRAVLCEISQLHHLQYLKIHQKMFTLRDSLKNESR